MNKNTDVFINYRRDDSKGYIDLIVSQISNQLPELKIFFDKSKIEYGYSISKEIQQGLESCKVLLCIIGPKWLEILEQREGLDDKDWVKEEILSAQKNDAIILPVLLPEAEKPEHIQLPKELKFLYDLDEFSFYSSKTKDLENRTRDLVQTLLRLLYDEDPSRIFGKKLRDYYLGSRQFTNIALPNTEGNLLKNSLSMDRYFISPSYIKMSDLQTKDLIIDKENQKSVAKIRKNAHLHKILPPDFAAFRLLVKNGNGLVIGNPGTGKSTFAKWLSYTWTKEKDNTTLPVYIALREVNWNADNSLFSELQKILNFHDRIQLEHILPKLAHQLIWILDGYDEISHPAKIKLHNTIEKIKAKYGSASYILLTRPYGLLHNPGFSFSEQIELDGFLPGQMQDYVETFLDIKNKKNKKTDFLDLLDSNPLIKDYAYNPMMLSFILSIYLKADRPREVLGSIDSQYDLQAKIYHLIMNRELDKGTAEKQTNHLKLTKAQAKLSYSMQIEKQFVKTGYNHDSWMQAAEELNNAGLARLISYKNDDSQINFSFNSVTFQEFLTSKLLNRSFDELLPSSLTLEAFNYLIRDSFFWNTSKMLIGGLWEHNKQDQKKAKEIVRGFRASYLTHKNVNAYYSYLVLLAECPKAFVKEQLQQPDLSEMYGLYAYNGHVATLWNSELNSALSRIYFKLDSELQLFFQDLVLNDILPSKEGQDVGEKNDMYSVPNGAKLLSFNLELFNESYFIKSIVNFLESNYKKKKPSEDFTYYTFESLSFIVDELLMKSSLKSLNSFKEQLTAILAVLPSIHFTAATRLKTKIEQADKNKSLEDRIDLLNHQLQSESTNAESIYDSLSAATEIFFTNYSNKLIESNKEKTEVFRFLKLAIDLANKHELEDDIEEIFQLAAEAVQKTTDPEIFECVYNFAVVANVSYSGVHFEAHEQLYEWYQESLNIALSSSDLSKFSMLTTALTNTESLQARFVKLRATYLKLMNAYIDKHYGYFEKYNGQFTISEFIDNSKEEYTILKPFSKLIYSCQEDNLLSEADKLSILDFILESERKDLQYFKDNFIPGFMSTHFHLHKAEHWSFVRAGLSAGKISNTISVLRNKQLYRIPSNINYLSELSTFLVVNYENEYFDDRKHLFIEFSCRCLRLMIQHKLSNQKLVDDITTLLSQDSTLKHFGTKACIKGIEGRDQLAYLLHFIVTREYLLGKEFDYNTSFKDEYADRADFINGIIDIFTTVHGLNTGSLNSLYPMLGDAMVKKVNFKIQANDLDFTFNRMDFERKLDQSHSSLMYTF